ncbi:MAG: AAA family ATPase, partial [Gemmatimonadaceae bacterium]
FCDGFVVPGAGDFDQWLEEERRRWQRRIVSVLVRAASLAEDRGHIHQSVALAERALALDPYADLAVQAVMRGYWLGGDRASAVTAGEAFRTRLERDLGVVPDETTAATMARISRERGPRRPPQAEAPAQRVPLIGREAELQALLDTWRAAADAKRPALLMVNGSGGSGRSRLIEEIISRATIAGATTIALHAVEVDARDEHAVVLGLAASGLHLAPGIAAAPSSALSAFAARLMEWADRFRAPSNVKPLPLRDAFTAVVRATAEERPIVLAIDDADRVHPDELRWFAALMRALTGVPVTLLLSVCTGPGHPGTDELLSDVGREIPGTIVTLDAFEMPELERLVGVVLHAWPADARDRLARRLMAESAGAPAIAVDVLHAVQHGLSLDTATHWPQPGR